MTDLFTTNQVDQSQIDPIEALTGPGAKFDKSKYENETEMWKAIARGKVEADQFIDHKNKEYDILRQDYLQLRDQYNAGPKLQEMIDQLKKQPTEERDNTQQAQIDNKPVVEPQDIEKIVAEQLLKAEAERKQRDNLKSVEAKLREHYGDNFAQTLSNRIETLGLTRDFVNDLAANHPTVLYRTLGLDETAKPENFQTPPKSGQRSDNFAPRTEKRTWSYYEKMRKENPRLYSDPKTQIQKLQDASALGEEFKDGNYHSVF